MFSFYNCKVTHVHARMPPMLILSASSDLGLEHDARRFVDQLNAAGVNHEYHVIPNTSHASIASQFDRNGAAPIVSGFIRRLHAQIKDKRLAILHAASESPSTSSSSSLSPSKLSSSSSSSLLTAAASVIDEDQVDIGFGQRHGMLEDSDASQRGSVKLRSIQDVEQAAQAAAEAVGL
jgi:hypothetical protein